MKFGAEGGRTGGPSKNVFFLVRFGLIIYEIRLVGREDERTKPECIDLRAGGLEDQAKMH